MVQSFTDQYLVKFDSWIPKIYPTTLNLYLVSGDVIPFGKYGKKLDISLDHDLDIDATSDERANTTKVLEILELQNNDKNSTENNSKNINSLKMHTNTNNININKSSNNTENDINADQSQKTSLLNQIRIEIKNHQVPQIQTIQRFISSGPSTIVVNQLNSNLELLSKYPSLHISRKPQNTYNIPNNTQNPKTLRLFFITSKNQSIKKKISLLKKLTFGIELLQLFFFCTLRSTFSLEKPSSQKRSSHKYQSNTNLFSSELYSTLNRDTTIEIHILKCSKSKQEFSELGNEWSIQDKEQRSSIFHYFKDLVEKYVTETPEIKNDNFMNLIFLGHSRNSKSLKKNIGHLYVSASNYSILSTNALKTWPSEEKEIVSCFSNLSPVAKDTIIDSINDSNESSSNLTSSLSRVAHTISSMFGVEEFLKRIDDEASTTTLTKDDSNITFIENTQKLTIRNIDIFFSPINLHSGDYRTSDQSSIFWNLGADITWKKSLYSQTSPKPIDIPNSNPNSKPFINIQSENADKLPSLKNRLIMSAPEQSNSKGAESNDPRMISSSGSLFPQLNNSDLSTFSFSTTKTDVPATQNLTQNTEQISKNHSKKEKDVITTYWEYDSGFFRQSNKDTKWKEFDKSTMKCIVKYDIVNTTHLYVLLYSPKKRFYICIDTEKCCFSRDGENFQLLHLGTFKKSEMIPKAPKRHKLIKDKIEKSIGDKWKSKESNVYFQKSQDDQELWIEYRNFHIFSHYKQLEQGAKYIILKDEDSGMLVKLEESQSLWKYELSSKWEKLLEGKFC